MISFGVLRTMKDCGKSRMKNRGLVRFLKHRRGTTAIEYGLITALISVTIISTVYSIGQGIKDTLYGKIVNALSSF